MNSLYVIIFCWPFLIGAHIPLSMWILLSLSSWDSLEIDMSKNTLSFFKILFISNLLLSLVSTFIAHESPLRTVATEALRTFLNETHFWCSSPVLKLISSNPANLNSFIFSFAILYDFAHQPFVTILVLKPFDEAYFIIFIKSAPKRVHSPPEKTTILMFGKLIRHLSKYFVIS